MTVLVQDYPEATSARDRAGQTLSAEIFSDLASVEALWRGLDASDATVATPYQRFEWIAAHLALVPEGSLRVVVLRDAAGAAQMLMPFTVSRRAGIAVARVVGAKHANYHMPLFASRRAITLRPEQIRAALADAGRKAGFDVYALDHQPRFWDGLANPLAEGGIRCASDGYGLLLGPDAESTLKRVFSGDARKKLRAKERKLAETFGPVSHRIGDGASIAAILDTFYAQKRERFAGMGIANPYQDERVRAFLAAASAGGGDRSAVEVHALVCQPADGPERILATFGGAIDRNRFSGMWTSFDADPQVARFSPGDVLLHRLIGQQTEAGRRAFDLGVGEARYKSSICDETIELLEVTIPVSLRGQVFAMAARAATKAKRRIKSSPMLYEATKRLRAMRAS